MKLKNRHYLRSNEIKTLKNEIKQKFGEKSIEIIFNKKPKIEIAKIENMFTVYIFDNEFILFRINQELVPSLKAIIDGKFDLPKIIVDSGAVKYILNGADIMRPGVVHIDDNIEKDSYVKIIEEKYQRPISIGLSLYDSDIMKQMKTGKIIKNIHYINDKIWKSLY